MTKNDILALKAVLENLTPDDAKKAQNLITLLFKFHDYVHQYHGQEFQGEHNRRKQSDYEKTPGYVIERLEKSQKQLQQKHDQMVAEYIKAQATMNSYYSDLSIIATLTNRAASQEKMIKLLDQQLISMQQDISRQRADFAHHEKSFSAHQAPPPPYNPAYNPLASAPYSNPPPSFVFPKP